MEYTSATISGRTTVRVKVGNVFAPASVKRGLVFEEWKISTHDEETKVIKKDFKRKRRLREPHRTFWAGERTGMDQSR